MSSLAYKDETPVEMLDGKIFAMSPRPAVWHNIIAGNIYRIFGNFLKGKTCLAIGDGTDVYLTEQDRVIPDVMVICNRSIIKNNGIHGAPDLIVEVLSPSTAKNDKGYKKNLYERCGVKEYWIVDPENRFVEVYLLEGDAYKLDGVYAVFPDYDEFNTSLYPDLIIALEDVFENVP